MEIYKYQAQAERERIKERQAQGIALAKAQGKYTGRKALFTEDDERLKHAFDLYLSGYSDKDVASMTGINERPQAVSDQIWDIKVTPSYRLRHPYNGKRKSFADF